MSLLMRLKAIIYWSFLDLQPAVDALEEIEHRLFDKGIHCKNNIKITVSPMIFRRLLAIGSIGVGIWGGHYVRIYGKNFAIEVDSNIYPTKVYVGYSD